MAGNRGARRRWPGVTAALALALTTAGCSDGDLSDLRRYISDIKQRPGGRIEPIPEMKAFDSYVYPEDPGRSPFDVLSFAEPREEREQNEPYTGPKPDETRPQEALEEFPLDSLTYVGTLRRNGEYWGLVKDPGGTIHRVQSGNYMGTNDGRITAVTPTAIELRELIPTPQGGWKESQASLALND